MRTYLRNRAGLPPIHTGTGVMNQGHQALFERELVYLHDVLPKDADAHDGLQLLDGADPDRFLALPPGIPGQETVAPPTPAVQAPPVAPAVAPPSPVPVVSETPPSPMVPTPSHPMRLAPLPADIPVLPGSEAARVAERELEGGWDDEQEEEIRPVSDEYAAQWQAYRAARR